MLKNYFLIAYRSFLRYRLYSFINIVGLALGIAFCILIYLFVQYEFTFDAFHKKGDSIYRIESVSEWKNEVNRSAILPCPLLPAMAEEIPEISSFTRYYESRLLFDVKGKRTEEVVQYVDPGFFSMFSFDLISGEPETVLQQPNSAVISETVAKKFYGNDKPVGEQLQARPLYGSREMEFVVSGVIRDAPANSSLQTNIILLMESGRCADDELWNMSSVHGFAEFHAESDPEDVISKTNELYDKYYPSENKPRISLTALADMYFEEGVAAWSKGKKSSREFSHILGGVALLILLIACINYVLLTLSNSTARSKEVGIRKVLGASKKTIKLQHLAETQLLTLMALFIGVTLVQVFLPAFEEFSQRELSLELLSKGEIFIVLLIILSLTSLIAGSYPAYYLSRLLPSHILKRNSASPIKINFSNVLVMIQLAVCIFFISCTLVMHQQMEFMTSKDLGFDKEFIVKVNTFNHENIDGNTVLRRFRQALANEKGIEQITAASGFPGFYSSMYFGYEDKQISASVADVRHDFFSTLGIEIIAGRNFSQDIASDSVNAVIINESMAKELGYADPVGEVFPADSSQIIGVIRNVHIASLEREIEPAFFKIGHSGVLLIRISGHDIPQTIATLEATWRNLISDQPLDYAFLDDEVEQMYAEYLRWQKIVQLSTLFCLLVACMGLFGLSGLQAARRSKEIAIRKVLGAGILELLKNLQKNTLLITVLAFILAVPFAYLAMQEWLTNFAYKIDLQWYWFGLAFIFGVAITLATVSYHTLKAALTNPVSSLGNE